MSSFTADACIVGAGPAGCAAAITLAEAGKSVVVIDKATFPRDKCCGDGLTTGALRLLERLGLEPSKVPSWTKVDDVFVRSPSGRVVEFPMPRDAGSYSVVARRFDLDSALVDRARTVGVTVLEETPFASCHTTADRSGVCITAGEHEITARYVIGADGMWSPLRRAVAPGHVLETDGRTYLGEWHAFRQYFMNVTGPAAEELWVVFEPDLLPGYFWTFPLPDGRANVGFGLVRGAGESMQHMKDLWSDLLARPHLAALLGPEAVPESPHRAWPIPARIDRATTSALGGRAMLVGDAACATDPMTGEGIGQALLTGILAAEAIACCGSNPEAAALWYERSIERGLVPDHRLAAVLSSWLRVPLLARAALRLAGLTAWTRRNFARWLFEDYPRAMIFTPRRWHRGMFTGPGAFSERA